MRVVLSTLGRFHSFDLARQMHRYKALEAIFSGYPAFKLRNERVPRERIRTFPWFHAPYMRLERHLHLLRSEWEWQDRERFDRHVAGRLPEADVFCALSSSGLHSGRAARARGVKYVCDRGSSHIREQDQILRAEYDRVGIPFRGIDARIIDKEEGEYDAADGITVPSTFALRSFTSRGISHKKVRLAPYGVDPQPSPVSPLKSYRDFRVLFAGALSVRKGVHDLIAAFDRIDHPRKRLTLIGPVEPALEPMIRRLRARRDIVVAGQKSREFVRAAMSASDAFVLASVEDGFGLVLAEALACGCPVVATTHTGAEDLYVDGVEGFIVPARNPEALASQLQLLADDPSRRDQMSRAAISRVLKLRGWNAYGDTMYSIFREVVNR